MRLPVPSTPLLYAMANSPTIYLLVILTLLAGCEIRPLDPVTGKAIIEEEQQSFDAASFVEENWETRILPSIQDQAIDLPTLLDKLKEDLALASSTYGHREGSRPFTFNIKGSGQVVRIDTTSRAGTLTLALREDLPEVVVQIGPVIRGTALRDALPFITFDQFVNQLEYARVSNAMHERLAQTVLEELDIGSFNQQEVNLVGVFSLTNIESITITPVALQVEGSP